MIDSPFIITMARRLKKLSETYEIVSFKDYSFAQKKPMRLESGASLGPITLRYETYGTLNRERSNAVLIEHGLSADHHAAGKYSHADKKPGWWNSMIGPKKAFDTNKYFVICVNALGSCSGSTGPGSINPKTKKTYGLTFPMVTIGDMVKAEVALMDHLGIQTLYAACGASMGGMKALHWSIYYPNRIANVIGIATTGSQNAQSIAFSEVGRQAIMHDPHWKQGRYSKTNLPKTGLSLARMMAHITYLSDESMRKKFGRKLQNKKKLDFTFDVEFQVESYLRYQGTKFISLFDANSYLYMSKALNYFDIGADFSSLKDAFKRATCRYLMIAFTSDWIYPLYMSKELVKGMLHAGRETSYVEIDTPSGHDAFLMEFEMITALIKGFLDA